MERIRYANRQFEREQALFKSMAKWGMSPEVTGPEGTTAGMQVSQLLSRIGSDVGEAGTVIKARNKAEQKELDALVIQLKEAEATGNVDLVQALSAQIGAIATLEISDITAKAAKLKAEGETKTPAGLGAKDIMAEINNVVGGDLTTDNLGNWVPVGEKSDDMNAVKEVYAQIYNGLKDSSSAKYGNITITMEDLNLPTEATINDYKYDRSYVENIQRSIIHAVARKLGVHISASISPNMSLIPETPNQNIKDSIFDINLDPKKTR